ncbi:MAG: (2Fe-2S) ferredoxin domain-containing protein [Ignavibacteriales bacterium]|nr:(2Fe-2S) ferredoxin domain-containing protein [Ignavibacteriales bacterium]
MGKLKIEDLEKIAEEARKKMTIREGGGRAKITVHMGTCGIAAGARNIMNTFLKEIETHDVHDVIITSTGCAGLCNKEPMITIELTGQAPVKYIQLTEAKAKRIFDEHIMKGKFVQEYAYAIGSEKIL